MPADWSFVDDAPQRDVHDARVAVTGRPVALTVPPRVAADPCASAPCVFGTCYRQGESFYWECEPGYAGTRCDEWATGYHPVGLQCVPD